VRGKRTEQRGRLSSWLVAVCSKVARVDVEPTTRP
jgi:hypothetical protein